MVTGVAAANLSAGAQWYSAGVEAANRFIGGETAEKVNSFTSSMLADMGFSRFVAEAGKSQAGPSSQTAGAVTGDMAKALAEAKVALAQGPSGNPDSIQRMPVAEQTDRSRR